MITDIFYTGFTLLLVIGLIIGLGWAARRFKLTPFTVANPATKEIKLRELAAIDPKTRLIEVEWRGNFYLLAGSENGIRKIDKYSALSADYSDPQDRKGTD